MIEFNKQQLHRFVALKDYYSILNIPVTASPSEIKQAYRKLVMIYHPDKNNNEPYALQKFNEIKEAYEVLTNPRKKDLYLQERWLNKASGIKVGEAIITPPNVLIQCIELNKSISGMDIHRMDFKGMAERINLLLNDKVIEKLISFGEHDINQTIVEIILNAIKSFPVKEVTKVTTRLKLLADADSKEKIHAFILAKSQQEQLERYKIIGILFLTIIICYVIYFAGKR